MCYLVPDFYYFASCSHSARLVLMLLINIYTHNDTMFRVQMCYAISYPEEEGHVSLHLCDCDSKSHIYGNKK